MISYTVYVCMVYMCIYAGLRKQGVGLYVSTTEKTGKIIFFKKYIPFHSSAKPIQFDPCELSFPSQISVVHSNSQTLYSMNSKIVN